MTVICYYATRTCEPFAIVLCYFLNSEMVLWYCAVMKKFYVVFVGRKPGVYLSWEDCHPQVDHFP